MCISDAIFCHLQYICHGGKSNLVEFQILPVEGSMLEFFIFYWQKLQLDFLAVEFEILPDWTSYHDIYRRICLTGTLDIHRTCSSYIYLAHKYM